MSVISPKRGGDNAGRFSEDASVGKKKTQKTPHSTMREGRLVVRPCSQLPRITALNKVPRNKSTQAFSENRLLSLPLFPELYKVHRELSQIAL